MSNNYYTDSPEEFTMQASEAAYWRAIENRDSAQLNAAIQTYRTEAEKGNPAAQAAMAYIFSCGMGVTINRTESRKWFDLADAQGHYIRK